MRILLAWASKNKKTDDLITALKNAGHEVPYWVGAVGHKTNKISDTVVHCYEDARNCIPASGIQVSDFSPPEESLVKQLHESESLILTMMNKHFDWMCVDERKHLYFNMLQYWNGVFKKYHPQVIIFSLLPHTPFLYVIYALAQLFGIKTIMFDGIAIGVPLGDRKIIFVNSWKKNSALERSMEKNKGKNFSLKDLSLDLQDYYMLHVAKSVDPTPVYLKNEKKLYSFQKILYKKIKILWKSIINMTFFEKALLYLAKRGKQNIKQEYQSLQKEADMEKKFIYLPLNYQPECTTSPQGDMFADQILMTETMAASLPADWNLYVKEHPAQWFTRGMNFFSSRYRGYYEKIARLKNVRLIPIDTDHYELLHHAQCIATVTGTAGFNNFSFSFCFISTSSSF